MPLGILLHAGRTFYTHFSSTHCTHSSDKRRIGLTASAFLNFVCCFGLDPIHVHLIPPNAGIKRSTNGNMLETDFNCTVTAKGRLMNKVLARDTSVDASNKNLKSFVIGMYNFVTGNSKSTIHFSRVEKSFSTDCI